MAVYPRPIVIKSDGTLIELPLGGWLEEIFARLEALEGAPSVPWGMLWEDGSPVAWEDGSDAAWEEFTP